MNFISDRANAMGESVTIKMARLAGDLKDEGKDVISLSLGEPDFDTPDFIKDAAKKAIDDNFSHYSPVPGFKELRQAVCTKLKRDNNLNYEMENIVVSTGAKHSLMNIILATINPGDEVILPAPYWVSYIEMVKFAQGIPVVIDTDVSEGFKITPEKLKKVITSKTKAFLFSNPCNPSGAAYSKEEIDGLVDVFKEHKNLLVLSDEIYEFINFKGKNISMASYPQIADRVITINGLSKGYAMTGWRLGYIAAPLEIAKACGKIQGQFTSGTNTICQRAAITALNESPSKMDYMIKEFVKRKDLFFGLLSKIKGLQLAQPEGAFYLFPDISSFYGKKTIEGETISTSEELCMYILKDSLVATTPGGAFGCPNNIRLSYALDEKSLKEAAKRIESSLAKLS